MNFIKRTTCLAAALLLIAPVIQAEGKREGECRPVIEADAEWKVIIVRPHENAFLVCTLTQAQLQDLIRSFLTQPENRQVEFKSIFFGRLVEHPWLSKYLAAHALAHDNWDVVKGQPKTGYINQLVRDILSAPDLLQQIQESFNGSGYTVVGASVEKVLVARANEIDWLELHESGFVPYDALTHFILKKTPSE